MKLVYVLAPLLFMVATGQYPELFSNPWFNSKFSNNRTSNSNYYPTFWRPEYYNRPHWFNNSGVQFRPRVGPIYPYPPGYCIDQNRLQCNGSHSLFTGCLRSNHKLLFQQTYNKTGRWYKSRSKIIDYPGNYGYVRNSTITAISIQDKMCNGTGGYAQITKGGVGSPQVQIQLNSRGIGTGFIFFVQIFGL